MPETTLPLGTQLEFSYSGTRGTLKVTYSVNPASGATITDAILIMDTAPFQDKKAYLTFLIPGDWTITLVGTPEIIDDRLEVRAVAAPFFGSVYGWHGPAATYNLTVHVEP
jgi:hypothetical protein